MTLGSRFEGLATRLENEWSRRGHWVLRGVVPLLAFVAALKLIGEFWRLAFDAGPLGAIDLLSRVMEVQLTFAGTLVYDKIGAAIYPPASYAMLWPFTGWLEPDHARWLWALVCALGLVWLLRRTILESGASSTLEQAFVGLLLLSMNAIGVSIGNGQPNVPLMCFLLGGLALLHGSRGDSRAEWLGAGLMLAALVKPTVAAPFFWLAVFLPSTFRPALLIVVGYAGLTLLTTSFVDAEFTEILQRLARRSLTAVTYGSSPQGELRAGYANIHGWLTSAGLARFNLPASLLVIGALGAWVRRNRQADFWLLLGTTAVVSRLWVYHRLYDDSIVLFSMLALYRIAAGGSPGDPRRVLAASLLALNTAVMLAPARIYEFWPNPWPIAFAAAHLGVWLAMLALLIFETERRRRNHAH